MKKLELREHASINDCMQAAINNEAHDTATFVLHGPGGSIKAKWLDAYFGLVEFEGSKGFNRASDFEGTNLWCSDLQIPEMEKA